jgi:hypothetical protein
VQCTSYPPCTVTAIQLKYQRAKILKFIKRENFIIFTISFKNYMRLVLLKKIYKTLIGYFLLILFCGYFVSITFFSHIHIVDGVPVVHSHPFRHNSSNAPVNHQHSENSFILIHFISHFITISSLVFYRVTILRKPLNILPSTTVENISKSFFRYCIYLPRAPTL